MPGSKNFDDSQKNSNYIYSRPGTADYLITLSISDMTETNRIPPKALKQSPLIVFYMAYDLAQRACATKSAIKNGIYMATKSWQHPTKNGKMSIKERFYDSACSFASQIIVSQNKDHAESVAFSSSHVQGAFERLYDMEEDYEVKEMFSGFVNRFKQKSLTKSRNINHQLALAPK